MNKSKLLNHILVIMLCSCSLFSRSGVLNVGFDIDDTVLFSRDVFLSIPKDKRDPIDYGWINTHDDGLSIYIKPTVDLINYFITNGHNVFFITARPGTNGEVLATFLSRGLNFLVKKNKNLFFSPSERIDGKSHTTKHRIMKRLKLDLFYGDGDSDIVASLKAGVHPVRIVRHEKSIIEYGPNYFGNTVDGKTKKSPYGVDDLNIFYSGKVGMFGETIYPIVWEGP
tara:strand:+ start:893 stop:1570 length:678 start_codon:yes stop_codon:yes gene_type:complete